MSTTSRSGSETESDGGAGAAKKVAEPDWAWNHCVALDPTSKSKIKCNYCDKKLQGGGITRFKHHIVGGNPNVAKCKKCPQGVRDDFNAAMKAKKTEKAGKKKAQELYCETLFNVKNRVPGSSEESDDDIVYPEGFADTPHLRRMYRRERRDRMKFEWEKAQAEEAQRAGAGSSRRNTYSPVIDIDDEPVRATPQSKRKKGSMDDYLRSASMRLTSRDSREPGVRMPEKSRQSTLGKFVKGLADAKEIVGRSVGRLFFAHGIPAHVASEPYLGQMIREIGSLGPAAADVKPPTAWELMNKYLPAQKEEILQWVEQMKDRYPEYGVTLMCDGWTSGNRKQIINFLVYCRGATVYLDSVDASGEVRNSSYIQGLLEKYLHRVGIQHVVQIVTDNGSSFKKAGQNLMKKYPIYWTPCAAHCIDLILKDMGTLPTVEHTITEARSITTYIYNHSFLLAAMRRKEYCNGDLVRPGPTRFATNFLALQSLKSKSDGLKRLFVGPEWASMKKERESTTGSYIESLVHKKEFWDRVRILLKIMEPIVRVLRLVDGDKSPTMGLLYDAMTQMRAAVERAAPRSSGQYLSIIDKRWNKMLVHPLHRAAYYFNPAFQYKYNIGLKSEFISAVKEVVERLLTSTNMRIAVMEQIRYYREGIGSFGHPNAIEARDKQDPIEWWAWHGTGCDELRSLAIRILSQTAAAGGCERNWSTFNLIHSKRRNKLGAQRLSDLVYVHYNMRLRSRNIREAAYREVDLSMIHDPIDTAYTFANFEDDDNNPLQDWMNEIGGAPALDRVQGQPDPIIEETYETASEDDLQEQQVDKSTPPGRLEPEQQHVAADMDIDRAVEKALSGASSSKSKNSKSHSSTSKSTSKSNDDDDTGGGSASGYRSPYDHGDDDDRPYLYEGGRQRTQVAAPPPEKEQELHKHHKVYQKKKTRGAKEYSGTGTLATYGQPQAPQYQSDAISDLAESVGSMSIADTTGGSNFANQLFGYPQSHTGSGPSGSGSGGAYNESGYSGYSGYGGGYDPYGYGSAQPQYEAPQATPVDTTYSFGYFGGFQTPEGTYGYSSSYHSHDGGQSWHGGESIVPIQQPVLMPMPLAYAPPEPQAPPQGQSMDDQQRALEEFYPKMGMMAMVNPEVYIEHIHTYNHVYRSDMTWAQYVNHINQIMYGERSTGGEEPARHSTYN